VKTAADFQTVLATLKTNGFLLESDPKLPSVCSLITGEPMRGSWWSHPLAQTIFQINEQLEDHDDVLITKLVSGKVTFIHRDIWSQVVTIGRSREPWQLDKLTPAIKALLAQVDSMGSLNTSEVVWPRKTGTKVGDGVRDLEKRLLIVATQFHSESGAHHKRLETWEHWMKQRKFRPIKISLNSAKTHLEAIVQRLNEAFGGSATLPWQ
jgi:hypothetical protein